MAIRPVAIYPTGGRMPYAPTSKRDASLLRAKSALRIRHSHFKNQVCDADPVSHVLLAQIPAILALFEPIANRKLFPNNDCLWEDAF